MVLALVAGAIVLLILIHNLCYKRLWDRGLEFRMRFSAKEAFEGDRVYLLEELHNKKFLPMPWIFAKIRMSSNLQLAQLEETEGEGEMNASDNTSESEQGEEDYFDFNTESSLYSIMMYTTTKRRKPFVCHKRGVCKVYDARLSASNLLYTRQFEKDYRIGSEMLIFPKTLENMPSVELVFRNMDMAILSRLPINPDPFEFRGIRDYLPTDALKTINFKATAISQKLKVNIQAPTCAFKLKLVLNLESAGMISNPELYEQSIRLAATFATRYIDQGVSVAFATNGKDSGTAKTSDLSSGTSPAHLYKILECLARLSLSYICEPLANYIDGLIDKDQVYIFISPHYGDNMLSTFAELEHRGIIAYLIIPTYNPGKLINLESNNTTVWDAS